MVWLAMLVLPHESTAVQVRVTVRSFGQEPGVVWSAKFKSAGPPQASFAVGVAKPGVAGHSMVVPSGNPRMTGGLLFSTRIVWLAVLVFPHSSVAVQIRVTEYFCGQVPGLDSSTKVSLTYSLQASVAVGVTKS